MRPRTPGFMGSRLREGREARGLSIATLAGLVGVSRQAISQLETGAVSPHPETFQKLATALNLPTHFFLRPPRPERAPTIFYRSMSSATKQERARGDRRTVWLRDVTAFLREFVELPEVRIPELGLPSDPSRLATEEIEAAAVAVRRSWGLGDGPISNIVWLLENNGCVVARDELGTEKLDAFSAWVDGVPYVFLGADKGSAVRSRYDAAHELGHLVLHRSLERARLTRPAELNRIEQQADRFAAAFLLPAASFAADLYVLTLDELRSLKPRWLVSIAAMLHRAEDLDLLPADEARRLWISYNRRRWRGKEPLDDELAVEQPRLLRRSFELTLTEAGQTRAEVLAALDLASTDVETLTNLPRGYLTDDRLAIRVLNLPNDQKRRPANSQASAGEIISFPTDRIEG